MAFLALLAVLFVATGTAAALHERMEHRGIATQDRTPHSDRHTEHDCPTCDLLHALHTPADPPTALPAVTVATSALELPCDLAPSIRLTPLRARGPPV